MQTPPFEINFQLAGVTQAKQLFFTTDEDESEEQYWARKKASRRNPANAEPTITLQTGSTLFTILKFQQPELQDRLRKTNQIVIEQYK